MLHTLILGILKNQSFLINQQSFQPRQDSSNHLCKIIKLINISRTHQYENGLTYLAHTLRKHGKAEIQAQLEGNAKFLEINFPTTKLNHMFILLLHSYQPSNLPSPKHGAKAIVRMSNNGKWRKREHRERENIFQK